jgi:hypothetical protein
MEYCLGNYWLESDSTLLRHCLQEVLILKLGRPLWRIQGSVSGGLYCTEDAVTAPCLWGTGIASVGLLVVVLPLRYLKRLLLAASELIQIP